MIFRNIVFFAVLVGLVSGLVYGVFQQTQLSPIIYAAEKFEVTEPDTPQNHTHTINSELHLHNEEAWSPEDGAQRIFWTMLANVLTGISFALVMMSFMALHNLLTNKPRIDAVRGIAWGVVGILAIFVAPSLLGLRPEVPGTIAAALELRQAWWLFGVLSTLAGIAILYYSPLKFKAIGIVVLALPYLLVGSTNEKHSFVNSEPEAISQLSNLTNQFFSMTAVGTTIFFIVLGISSGFVIKKFIKFDSQSSQA